METLKCDNCGRETDLVFETFGELYCAECGTGKMRPLMEKTEPVTG